MTGKFKLYISEQTPSEETLEAYEALDYEEVTNCEVCDYGKSDCNDDNDNKAKQKGVIS